MNCSELESLLAANPIYIPISAAASFLRTSPASLRAAIDQGRCPFGFSWKIGDRSGYKIPTITFFAWITKGVPFTT